MARILVVDDDEDILKLVESILAAEGFEVHVARDGPAGLARAAELSPDVVVLDVMLPGADGLSVCRELRQGSRVPILMLSARGEEIDKVLGLELGADDYLAKPFQSRELVARIRAMLRRWTMAREHSEPEMIVCGPVRINLSGQRVELKGREVPLTPIEFSLLTHLARNHGQVLSRQRLLDLVWGEEFPGDERTVDSHVSKLRAKLQKVAPGDYIRGVWGVGYRFEAGSR